MDTINWVDELVAKLTASVDGTIQVQLGGETVSAFFGKQTIEWFKNNKILLLRVGKRAFKDFLMLLAEKKEEQAFALLLEKMDAENIIARMNMNSAMLKDDNNLHDQFVASLKKFVVTTLTALAAKVIIGLIV